VPLNASELRIVKKKIHLPVNPSSHSSRLYRLNPISSWALTAGILLPVAGCVFVSLPCRTAPLESGNLAAPLRSPGPELQPEQPSQQVLFSIPWKMQIAHIHFLESPNSNV
jgi:hypothetical protein